MVISIFSVFKSSVFENSVFMGFCYQSGWDTVQINHSKVILSNK